MSQLHIPSDIGNDISNKLAWQRTESNFTDLYSIQSRTINAGDVRFVYDPVTNPGGATTTEGRIALADAAAVAELAGILYIPAFMMQGGYDISLCPPTASIQRTREGGDSSVYDVRAYGAAGNAVKDDYLSFFYAIQGAVSGTGWALLGGVVYVPPGKYYTSAPIVLPVASQQGQCIIRGAGMRFTYIYGQGTASTFSSGIVRMGTDTPDAAGTSTNVTQYCGIENIGVSGTLLTGAADAVGIQLTEANYCWMHNVIIENLPNNSMGLYLLGSTVTGGLGTGTTAPHTRLCNFNNVLSVTSRRPLVIQNGDENSFFACDFGVTPGLTAGADSLSAVEVQLGRSNRWYGCLVAGETTSLKTAYVGYKFGPPVNAVGTPNGGVSSNTVYGGVGEGFDRVAWNVADASGNTIGNGCIQLHASIYNTAFVDGNTQKGQGFFFVDTFKQTGGPLNYWSLRAPYCDSITISGTSPDLAQGNTFNCSNGGATMMTSFTNLANGETKTIRLDANTGITNSASMRCPGSVDVTAAAHKMCKVTAIGGTVYVTDVTQC